MPTKALGTNLPDSEDKLFLLEGVSANKLPF